MKTLNHFNNVCCLKTWFDLKMQDLFKTSNQREYQKCWTKFYKNSISRLQINESIQ